MPAVTLAGGTPEMVGGVLAGGGVVGRAVTWIRNYGKGRVFYSSLGHTEESWNRPDVQKMWLEAVKWSMKLTDGTAQPRPRPAN